MDAGEKFKEKLLDKKKYQMHQKFFEEDGDIQNIVVPIMTQFTGKIQIIPYRNKKCLRPDCVYDINELLTRYINSCYSNYLNFVCHTCLKHIDISDFYLDQTLREIIDIIWQRYNKSNKIQCEKIIIKRDNSWEPSLPKYYQQLESQMRKNIFKKQDNNKDENLIKGNQQNNDDNQVKQIYQNFIQLNEYDKEEYEDLLYDYKNTNKVFKKQDTFFRRYDNRISYQEFNSLLGDSYFSKGVMGILLRYFEDWVERKKQKPFIFMEIRIKDYDFFYKSVQFEIINDNRPEIRKKFTSSTWSKEIDKVFIIMNLDERWILGMYIFATKDYRVVDFLESQLSNIQALQIREIFSFVLEKEIPGAKIQILKEKAISEKSLNFLSDCGIYISTYLYKELISNYQVGQFLNTRIRFSDKEKFRDQLCWWILKLKDDDEKQVPVFDIPGTKKAINDQSHQDSASLSINQDQDNSQYHSIPNEQIDQELKKGWNFSSDNDDKLPRINSQASSQAQSQPHSAQKSQTRSHKSSIQQLNIPQKQDNLDQSFQPPRSHNISRLSNKTLDLENQLQKQSNNGSQQSQFRQPTLQQSRYSNYDNHPMFNDLNQQKQPIPNEDNEVIDMTKEDFINMIKDFRENVLKEAKDQYEIQQREIDEIKRAEGCRDDVDDLDHQVDKQIQYLDEVAQFDQNNLAIRLKVKQDEEEQLKLEQDKKDYKLFQQLEKLNKKDLITLYKRLKQQNNGLSDQQFQNQNNPYYYPQQNAFNQQYVNQNANQEGFSQEDVHQLMLWDQMLNGYLGQQQQDEEDNEDKKEKKHKKKKKKQKKTDK